MVSTQYKYGYVGRGAGAYLQITAFGATAIAEATVAINAHESRGKLAIGIVGTGIARISCTCACAVRFHEGPLGTEIRWANHLPIGLRNNSLGHGQESTFSRTRVIF